MVAILQGALKGGIIHFMNQKWSSDNVIILNNSHHGCQINIPLSS